MTVIIPPQQDKKWTQTNTGELLGTLASTRNMDFDQFGYAKLNRRTIAFISDLTGYNLPLSFSTIDGVNYYVMASSGPFKLRLDTLSVTSLNNTGHTGSLNYDGIIWKNSNWYISQSGSFSYYDITGATWYTGIGSFTNTSSPHPLCVHEGLNYLCVGDGNLVQMYSTSYSGTGAATLTITLPSNFEVRWICYDNGYIYIGTRNTASGDAEVFVADGSTTGWQNSYRVPNSSWVFSGVIWKGVPVVFGSNGQLLRFNGSGFDELAHLPSFLTPYAWYDGSGFSGGKISQRGMSVKNDKIYINLDGYVNSPATIQPYQPSGVWCFDEKVGLYHMGGLSNTSITSDTIGSINTSTDVLTLNTATSAITGTPVLFSGTAGGLVDKEIYYLISVSSTTCKLATSYANAIAGTAVDITSFSNGSLYIHTDFNYGETINNTYQPGAVVPISDFDTTQAVYQGYLASRFIFGAGEIFQNTGGTLKYTLQTFTTGTNRGSIVTQKITSSALKDEWNKLYAKFGNLFRDDKAVLKYRTKDKVDMPKYVAGTCTWSDAHTFTLVQDSVYRDLSMVSVGDEIEICSGRGSGCSVHISSISYVGGTWTVVVDEDIPNVSASDASYTLFIQNWNKLNTPATPSLVDSLYESVITDTTKWIQLKIELRGQSNPFVEEIQMANIPFRPTI